MLCQVYVCVFTCIFRPIAHHFTAALRSVMGTGFPYRFPFPIPFSYLHLTTEITQRPLSVSSISFMFHVCASCCHRKLGQNCYDHRYTRRHTHTRRGCPAMQLYIDRLQLVRGVLPLYRVRLFDKCSSSSVRFGSAATFCTLGDHGSGVEWLKWAPLEEGSN